MSDFKIALQKILLDFASVASEANLTGISLDSRNVKPGDLFLAYPGGAQDGRNFIAEALAKGAAAVLYESKGALAFSLPKTKIPCIAISELASKASLLAARFYNEPAKDLQVYAVTGTNGKTSCAYLLAEALNLLNQKAAYMGTLGYGLPEALKTTTHTTPDAMTVQKILAELRDQNYRAIAIEASSHALHQGRLNAANVKLGIFTNLTRDHLDYHHDMLSYTAAKKLLFEMPSLKQGVFNVDDEVGAQFAHEFNDKISVVGFSLMFPRTSLPCVYTKKITMDLTGTHLLLETPWGEAEIQSRLLGEFNVSNLLAVITSLGMLGYALSDIVRVVAQLKSVPGRIQVLGGQKNPLFVVDYAHTPDALEKLLKTLRPLCLGKLICVFGCGGDRDRGKRPMMAAIAEQFSDQVILTNDNPRFENPETIFADILAGFQKPEEVIQESDRARAIARARSLATDQDMIVVAGKGHEAYQIIRDQKNAFSDVEAIQTMLN